MVDTAPHEPACDDEVLAYTGLAISLARRYEGRGEPLDDLKQVALLALVKASRRFDPTRGVTFSTYASATVIGELKRHFRSRWGLHVGRGDQERYLAVRDAADELTHRLGRRPTVEDLSDATGIEADRVRAAMSVGAAFAIGSLDRAASHGSECEAANPDDPFERRDLVECLRPLIAALPDREREVLRLRFGADLPQTEIADRLGLSQMMVSRTLYRTLRRLREHLAA